MYRRLLGPDRSRLLLTRGISKTAHSVRPSVLTPTSSTLICNNNRESRQLLLNQTYSGRFQDVNTSIIRCMGHGTPSHWKTDKEIDEQQLTSMNHLPVPQGSWQESYRENQKKYNIYLAASASLLGLTLFGMYKAKCFEFNPGPIYKNVVIEDLATTGSESGADVEVNLDVVPETEEEASEPVVEEEIAAETAEELVAEAASTEEAAPKEPEEEPVAPVAPVEESEEPAAAPAEEPAAAPAEEPAAAPAEEPAAAPAEEPAAAPTEEPAAAPAEEPAAAPAEEPAAAPAEEPAAAPVEEPAAAPAEEPAAAPAEEPAAAPAEEPAAAPAEEPAAAPAEEPAAAPAEEPAATPAEEPAATPAEEPAATPAEEPAATPAEEPATEAAAPPPPGDEPPPPPPPAEDTSEPPPPPAEDSSPVAAGESPSTDTSVIAEKDVHSVAIDWSKVPDIPNHVPYLLVGAGTASFAAFSLFLYWFSGKM